MDTTLIRPKNYYQILQVDPEAEPEIISAAYKRLAQKYHPDTNTSHTANLRMQEINQAYQVLRNSNTRIVYNTQLASQFALVDLQSELDERRRREDVEVARRQAEYTRQQSARATAVRRGKRTLLIAVLVCIIIFNVSATAVVILQPKFILSQPQVLGVWNGEWTNQKGYVYNFRIKMKINAENEVAGTITWVLKSSPRLREQLQIGRQATVYVKGTFDPKHRLVTMGSYRQDDPYDVVDVNEYRLYLSADDSTLSGETYNDGVWEGKVSTSRQE